MLEVSRSFGDVAFKPLGVVATPDVRVRFALGALDEVQCNVAQRDAT